MLQDQKNVVSVIIPNLDEVMQMIEKNIFRPLPNVKKSNLGFTETGIDQEEEMDPAWPHLQGIYEFFLQLVINESVEVRSLKVYVTPQFVQEFLELFDSEESVERDYLKNILHKLYAKVSCLLDLRPYALFQYVYRCRVRNAQNLIKSFIVGTPPKNDQKSN